MLKNFKSETKISKKKIVGLSSQVGLNRGKLADTDKGEIKAWLACPSRFETDRTKGVKSF